MRQADQGPLHPIYGGGLVLLCPNRTPRQLTTRRQKVAVTHMLGNSAMTETSRARARPGNSLARRSRKRRDPAGQAADPVDQMHAGSTRGRPSRRPRRPRQSRQEGRAHQRDYVGYKWPPGGPFVSHIFKTGSRGPVARRARVPVMPWRSSRRYAARNAVRGTRHAAGGTGHAALSDPGRCLTDTAGRPCSICRDSLGFRAPG